MEDNLAYVLLQLLKKAATKKEPWLYIEGALDQLPTSQAKAAIGFKIDTPRRTRKRKKR